MKINLIVAAVFMILLPFIANASGTHGGSHDEATAIGAPGKGEKVNRTIKVEMFDTMRFSPESITVKQGETIRFIVKNSGKIKHEMVLGTEKDLKEHYEAMKKNPEMEHADENMVTVEPGKTGEMIWHFTKAGKVGFACLIPGHYDAGMKGSVRVKPGVVKSDGHDKHKH